MTTANERLNIPAHWKKNLTDQVAIQTRKYNDLKKKYDNLVHLKKSNEQKLNMRIIQLTKQLKHEYFEENIDTETFGNSLRAYIESVYGVDLGKRSRTRTLVEARGMYYTLMRKYTNESLKNMGFNIGNYDHTTVLHSLNMTQDLLETQRIFRQQYEKHEKFIEETLIKKAQ